MDILCFSVGGIDLCMEASAGNIEKISFRKGEIRERPLNAVLSEAEKQIVEYFSGTRKEFSIPFRTSVPAFHKKVYEAVGKIPYAETMTYKEVAVMLGDAKKARAVGNALHRNPLPIITPCHRVIRSNGTDGGFNGGTNIKKILLDLERKCVS